VDREEVIARLKRRAPGRRGFGGTSNPQEAAEVRASVRGDTAVTPDMTRPSAALTPAAVLVPLVDRPDGLTILLTQRTAHLQSHAGQISFPGGRKEPDDADAVATALRETEEEVGLPRQHITVVGQLDNYVTGTGFEVTPIVGIVTPPFPIVIDPFEVAEAFEVPLSYVLDGANHHQVERESAGRRRVFYVLPYEGRNIWGATAGMLVNLAEVLAG
jgi:8-oxo-dGTP pyrophosphatase MutT (NUDIX family)